MSYWDGTSWQPDSSAPQPPASPATSGTFAPPSVQSGQESPGGFQWASPEPPRGSGPRWPRILAVVGSVGAVGGTMLAKFGFGFLAASVVSGAVSSMFGGPLSRLPADQRAAYERRLEAAVGTRLDALSDDAAEDRLNDWIFDGLLRMNDEQLVRRFELEVNALMRADVGACAQFARQALSDGEVSSSLSTAIINALETADLGDWVRLNIEGLEAEMRASPAQKLVSKQSAVNVMDRLFARLAQPTQDTLVALASGGGAPDAEACAAIRTMYATVLNLDPSSRDIIARYDVQAE